MTTTATTSPRNSGQPPPQDRAEAFLLNSFSQKHPDPLVGLVGGRRRVVSSYRDADGCVGGGGAGRAPACDLLCTTLDRPCSQAQPEAVLEQTLPTARSTTGNTRHLPASRPTGVVGSNWRYLFRRLRVAPIGSASRNANACVSESGALTWPEASAPNLLDT